MGSTPSAKKQDARDLTAGVTEDWKNFVVGEVNDHVVRLSVLARDFHWHSHKNSDEYFYVVEGNLFVDFDSGTQSLGPGQMITVPKGVRHRTRSQTRTILLCFESADNDVTGDE